jgi:hypothetical protein
MSALVSGCASGTIHAWCKPVVETIEGRYAGEMSLYQEPSGELGFMEWPRDRCSSSRGPANTFRGALEEIPVHTVLLNARSMPDLGIKSLIYKTGVTNYKPAGNNSILPMYPIKYINRVVPRCRATDMTDQKYTQYHRPLRPLITFNHGV